MQVIIDLELVLVRLQIRAAPKSNVLTSQWRKMDMSKGHIALLEAVLILLVSLVLWPEGS